MSRPRFVAALIVVAAAARSISLTWLHPLNWDEIEYLRATDWVRQGLVPYRDFWEHHTPLHWFVFAPVAALIRSDGASAVIAMRWAQVPLWIATFVLLSLWMRRAGISLTGRLIAILFALCSSMFMLPAVEYRIDVLGSALYIAALVLLQDADRKFWYAFAGGAALCLAGFANIRLGPLLALTALIFRIVRPRERSWGGNKTANGIFAGAVAAFAACAMYFVATHSVAVAIRRVWTENYLGERLSQGTEGVLLHRIAVLFGFRPLDRAQALFDPAAFDLSSAILLIVGTIGVVRILVTRWRAPDHLFVLAFLQVANVLFVAAMKFIYTYHFEIVVLLMLPFVAAEIDRLSERRWSLVAAALVLVSAINIFASVFRGKEADLAYQDLIMREVHRRTPANSKVFDGAGWALRRQPAYRYWFLPMLVVSLEKNGVFEPYEMAADPPAAIISDHNAYRWLESHSRLAAFATSHYLPLWRNLWLTGLSARLTPGATAEWIVPVSGAYRVYGSEVLSTHPWFRKPLLFGTFESRGAEIALRGFPPADRLPLAWSLDGTPLKMGDSVVVQRKQRLRVTSHGGRPLGVMIVPVDVNELFLQPPHGVTLDGAAPAVTHVPFR